MRTFWNMVAICWAVALIIDLILGHYGNLSLDALWLVVVLYMSERP